MTIKHLPVLLLSGCLLPACGDDSSSDNGEGADAGTEEDATIGQDDALATDAESPDAEAGDATRDEDGSAIADLPSLNELEAGWNVLEPGGETVCSRGTEFKFGVRTGAVNRVVIDFMGGGACWDATTCSLSGQIFNDSVEGLDDDLQSDSFSGIYDTTNPDNPFRDWYHVYIPYCTGDIHWGDATTRYNDNLTIEHRGRVNAAVVMEWVEANFDAPETIFITGCSAGAYGSIGWAPHIIDAFPDSDIAHLGDSGVGIITDEFFRDSFPSWNAESILPSWIDELNPDLVDIYELTVSDIYGRLASFYPDIVFSQYTTAYDDNQTFYFQAMGGGDQLAWSERMYEQIAAAREQAPNFASYIAPGERHCIIPFDEFYEVEADGVPLTDWVDELVAGQNPGHVACVDCQPPE